jgi:hypothetical protein
MWTVRSAGTVTGSTVHIGEREHASTSFHDQYRSNFWALRAAAVPQS